MLFCQGDSMGHSGLYRSLVPTDVQTAFCDD